MKLREWWKTLPGDVQMAYACVPGFILWLMLFVVLGPHAFFLAPWCLVYPLLAGVVVVLLIRLDPRRELAHRMHRRRRVLALLLVAGCLVTFFGTPWSTVCIDLHLMGRIYLAGGPEALNDWAQDLIREQEHKGNQSRSVDQARIPPRVRTYLPGYVTVGGTLWSDLVRLRIELGGGFYHYGVVVYPRGNAPPPEWWHGIIGWPPEVVVYRE